MCYPKPGPRCSNHARKAYKKAQLAYKQDPTGTKRNTLIKATRDFMTTPAGIKTLERLAERAEYEDKKQNFQSQAEKAREARKKAIEAYKKETGQDVLEEEDSVVRPSQFMSDTFLEASYVPDSKIELFDKLEKQGGVAEVQAIYDLDGNLVVADRLIDEWWIVDPKNPNGNYISKYKGHFSPRNDKKTNARLGFYVGTAIVPAVVGDRHKGSSSYVIEAENKRMDTQAIPVDNGHTNHKKMEMIREKTYSEAYKKQHAEKML